MDTYIVTNINTNMAINTTIDTITYMGTYMGMYMNKRKSLHTNTKTITDIIMDKNIHLFAYKYKNKISLQVNVLKNHKHTTICMKIQHMLQNRYLSIQLYIMWYTSKQCPQLYLFYASVIKREKYKINKKKTIRRNEIRNPQKIAVTTKIPNNGNKILQKPRKTSKILENKPQKPRKVPKFNSKKLQKLGKISKKLRKIRQNLTKNKKPQTKILDNINKKKNMEEKK
jgi:hypothetical protein